VPDKSRFISWVRENEALFPVSQGDQAHRRFREKGQQFVIGEPAHLV
jgi:hypothetical protein